MTADQLNKLQQESKERHLNRTPFFNMCVEVAKEEPKEEIIEPPKTLSQLIDESYEFHEGDLKPKKQKRKEIKKEFHVDLMASQIVVPSPSEQKEIPVIKKQEAMGTETKVWDSMFNKPHTPKPVQKKEIIRIKSLIPEPPQQKWERPPAVYSNSASYYGIYDELKEEWNKKTG